MKNFSIEIPVWKILLVVKEQNKKVKTKKQCWTFYIARLL